MKILQTKQKNSGSHPYVTLTCGIAQIDLSPSLLVWFEVMKSVTGLN